MGLDGKGRDGMASYETALNEKRQYGTGKDDTGREGKEMGWAIWEGTEWNVTKHEEKRRNRKGKERL